MLKRTRYLLTGWYIFITLLVSIIFSVFIYIGVSRPLKDLSRISELNKQNPSLNIPFPQQHPRFLPADVTPEMIEARVKMLLFLVNIILVFVSAGGGYFLAGKSLQPVEEMFDEQNRFISDASHELRTPITAIRTELEVASMNKDLGSDAQKVLKSNLDEIIYLQNLANDLLELNKYEKEKHSLHFASCNLLDISEKSMTIVIPLLKERHITIDNQLQDVNVRGDKFSLIRIFTILLENAAKYSTQHKVISLRSRLERGNIVIDVIDQGIGISEADKKRIFDRFYRVDKARSRHTMSGYGLGLAIANIIVKKHSGKMTVTSTPGTGSTFTVSLPHFA